MTTINVTALEASVEALIQQQLAAYEAQLREALARALQAQARPSSPRRKGVKPKVAVAPPAQRRSSEELGALGERFFAAVESAPGETMEVLARTLGMGSKQLERAVMRLKETGRIRTVGERNQMRYYPMVRVA